MRLSGATSLKRVIAILMNTNSTRVVPIIVYRGQRRSQRRRRSPSVAHDWVGRQRAGVADRKRQVTNLKSQVVIVRCPRLKDFIFDLNHPGSKKAGGKSQFQLANTSNSRRQTLAKREIPGLRFWSANNLNIQKIHKKDVNILILFTIPACQNSLSEHQYFE